MLRALLKRIVRGRKRTRAILLSTALLVILGVSQTTFAQPPSLGIILRVEADGTGPFDGTTYDVNAATNPGTDANATNDVVRLLDYVTYRAEVSVNDADQSDVTIRFMADQDQKWLTIPGPCLTSGVSPVSAIMDSDGNAGNGDDKRLLICNTGNHKEGIKLVVSPVAQVRGTAHNATISDNTACQAVAGMGALDSVRGCVSLGATIESDTHGQLQSSYVSTLTTADFNVNLTKVAPMRPPIPPGTFVPELHNQAGPSGLGIGNGQVVDWVVSAVAARGSEGIQGDINGQRTFVLTDTFIDDNPNNNIGLADGSSNADRSSNGRLFSWNPSYPACQAIGTSIGSISCTQGGGTGAGAADNGAPITVTLNNVDVTYPDTEGQVFKFKLRMWVPIDSNQAAPNNHDIMSNTTNCAGTCTVNISNRIVGLDTPDPLLDGPSPTITSVTSQQNYDGSGEPGGGIPGTGDNLFTVPVSSGGGPGSVILGGKSFWSGDGGFNHVSAGTKAVSQNEIVPVQIWAGTANNSIYNLKKTGWIKTCDPLDTSNVEFVGTPADGEVHDNPGYGANPRFAGFGWAAGKNSHYLWDANPILSLGGGAPAVNQWETASALTNTNIRLEYTDVVHSNTPTSLRNYNCSDDLDGDTTNDWVMDYTTLPGGASSVTAVRLIMDNIDIDELNTLFDANSSDIASAGAQAVFNVRVKSDAVGYNVPTASIPDNYIPNFANLQYRLSTDVAASAVGRAPLATEDPSNSTFSLANVVADRVRIVAARMGIDKQLADPDQKAIFAGQTAEFKVSPALVGLSATPVDLTLTDSFPTSPSTMTYVPGSFRVDPTCATSNGTYGTPSVVGSQLSVTITGVTAGQSVCPFYLTLQAAMNAPAGNYINSATITSSDTAINDDSKAPDGSDPISSASVQIVASAGYRVDKFNTVSVYEVNQPVSQQLTYSNFGAQNYTAGNFIDVLPYNGDSGGFTLREDTLTPNPLTASSYTNNDGGTNTSIVGLTGAPTGVNGETFSYTTASPSTIPIDPCHSANQTVGFVPSSGHYCYQRYVDNGNQFADGSSVGTGTITWSASAPADWDDVTAIRWNSTAHNAGQPARTVTMTLAPKNNNEGDIYCNNFAGQVPEIALEIISNDVCERVVAGTISGTVFNDANASSGNFVANSGDNAYEGVQVQLLDAAGDPYDIDPATAGLQPYIVTTNSDGEYAFTNLPSGTYQTVVINPPVLDQTYDYDDGSSPVPTSFLTANNSGPIILEGPAVDAELSDVDNEVQVDFGYTQPASVGSFVWRDLNQDGIQNAGEPGIANVTVQLLNISGTVLATTVTDSNGGYVFTGLPSGSYQIRFVPPDGLMATQQGSGSDRALDSNFDPKTSTTAVFALGIGENNMTLDAGLVPGVPGAPLAGVMNATISGLIAMVGVASAAGGLKAAAHHRRKTASESRT